MKKIIAGVLILAMFLGLCGCGQNEYSPLSAEKFKQKWNVKPLAKKVILDIDLMYVYDDVEALFAALQADKLGYIDLLGISAVCGNTFVAGSAYDTLAILEQVGRTDIPVFLGIDEPVSGFIDFEKYKASAGKMKFGGCYGLKDKYTNDYKQAANKGIAKWKKFVPSIEPQKQSAVDFIIEQIHKYPGEVTVMALGGLTTEATALQKDPTLAKDAAGIVYMGGVFDSASEDIKGVEFNFWFDPKATNICLGADWKKQVTISHDAATTCLKGYDIYEQMQTKSDNPFTKILIDYYREKYGDKIKEGFEKQEMLFCWDPITFAYILSPDICAKPETRYVYIDEREGRTYGMTLEWKDGSQPEGAKKVETVLSVNRDKFWEFLLDLYDAR